MLILNFVYILDIFIISQNILNLLKSNLSEKYRMTSPLEFLKVSHMRKLTGSMCTLFF